MAYRYPNAEIQFFDYFAATLGTFVRDYYAGPPSKTELARWFVRETEQTHDRLSDLFASLSRRTIPLLRRETWSTIELPESELGDGVSSLPKYGEGYVHGGPPQLFYGTSLAGRALYFDAPLTLRKCPVICSSVGNEAVVWLDGIDYRFDAETGSIELLNDPFADDRFEIQNVYENNEIVDRTVRLHLLSAEYDDDQLYKQFGYVYRMRLPSQEGTRRLLNAVADAAVRGSSEANIREVIAASLGVPLALSDETVEAVGSDARGPYVLTDQRLYRLPVGSTASVAAGDALAQYDSVCAELQFDRLNRGRVPDYLEGLSFGRGFIPQSEFWGELYFENADLPLTVEEDVDGYTKVSFPLGGHPSDAEAFWRIVHERGVAAERTLAHLLDLRPNPDSEPTAANLPATVNPLSFLTKNLLRFHLMVVRVALPRLGDDSVGLHALRWLRSVLPPDLCVLVLSSGRVTDELGEDDLEDSAELTMTSVATDELDDSDVEETVRLRSVSGRCL